MNLQGNPLTVDFTGGYYSVLVSIMVMSMVTSVTLILPSLLMSPQI